MTDFSQRSETTSLPGTVILGRLRPVAGPGSRLYGDLVMTPRIGGSFGGFPLLSSAIARPDADPSATYARFLFGA